MNLWHITIMIASGMLIPVAASLNAQLASTLNSVPIAVIVFFVAALVAAVVQHLASQDPFPSNAVTSLSWRTVPCLFAGLGVFFYITSVSTLGAQLGMGACIVCVLIGQLMSILLIDHNGWFGMPTTPMSITRLMGFLLLVTGAYFILIDPVRPG